MNKSANSSSANSSNPNRRRSPRRKPRGYVKLKCRKGWLGLGPNVAITLLDVSESGARLVVRQELALQREVEVELEAHGINHLIKRVANVRWQLKLEDGTFCIGIEFEKPLAYSDWQNLVIF
jgi:hypothetical protein